MKVSTQYQGHVFELDRGLGSIRFIIDGEVRDMTGGKLLQHKIDQVYEAEILDGNHQGAVVRAELKLGLFYDKVRFYFQDQLIEEKKLF
jgi:hypothetical protein